MRGRRIRSFFELTPYGLLSSVEALVQQIQFDQLVYDRQVIWRELCSLLKCLASFLISFRLPEGKTERCLNLWVLRRELGLLLKDYGGVVESIKRTISGGQEHCSVSEFRCVPEQIGHRFDHHVSMTRAQIDISKQQNRLWVVRISGDGFVEHDLGLVHLIIAEICTCQLVFDERRAWIGLIDSLQYFDCFFRFALCQQDIALPSAAIDILRVATKNIFEKRESLVVFLILSGKLGQQDPAWQIIRRLFGHLGGSCSIFLRTA